MLGLTKILDRPIRSGFVLLALLQFFGVARNPAEAHTRADETSSIALALQNREFEKALELLRSALQSSPNNPQLWTMQGVAYSGEGHKQQALVSFNHALNISAEYLPALHGAIQIEFDDGSAAAIPLLRRVLRLVPSDQTSHGMLAVLEYQQGNCTAAITHFDKAGALFNSQSSALHAYATCLVKVKQFDQAANIFQHTLALDPDNQKERRLLASIQLMAHKPQEAVTTLAPLLESGNTDPQSLELVASAYEDAGETEKAVNSLRQAILLDPKNENLYLDFAYVCFSHQSFQVGINVVSDGISQQPDAAQLYFARGVLYVQVADYAKAEADLEKAYELDPGQSLTAAAQGLLAVQQNDFDRALADVQRKLKQKPNDALLLYLQADVLTQKGADPGTPAFHLALESAKRAVSLRPSLAAARAVLAKLYLQSGQNQQAADQCRRALEIDPKDQTSLYRLIQALRKTGKRAEVPELLKRLALLRQESAKEQKQRYRYKLVEGDPP
jgi:tetratricopeptide (TPR) repeat protein